MAKKRRGTGKRGKQTDNLRILIVEGRFYDHISDELLRGATHALEEAGVRYDRVSVPGALEIPIAIAIAVDAARRRRAPYDGVVALGCVIRGETYHFEIVANESARALMDFCVKEKLPIGNGILTVEDEAQAQKRAAGKGSVAARVALTMIALKQTLAWQ